MRMDLLFKLNSRWTIVVLIALGGCADQHTNPLAVHPQASTRAVITADDKVIDQTSAVWQQGAAAIPPQETGGVHRDLNWDPDVKFEGLNADAQAFLSHPRMKPAVQFGCAVSPTHYENVLVDALSDAEPMHRLQALVLLMKARSPSTVDQQLKTLQALKMLDRGPAWSALLDQLAACFDSTVLLKQLDHDPPLSKFDRPPAEFVWTVRAVAAIHLTAALNDLRRFSTDRNLDISLAAERSLEDFDGPQADEALAHCVAGWRYDAAGRAGGALKKRNPAILRETILAHPAPADAEYLAGLFLAECDDPAAVPLLCRRVGQYQMIDAEMFRQIARLARREDINLVEALPKQVRKEQAQNAAETVDAVHRRYRIAAAD